MTDAQLLRGAANAVFPNLRRDKWETFTSSTVNDPTGNPTAHRLSPAGFPNPPSNPRVDTIDSTSGIRGYVFSHEDYPGDVTYAVRLDRAEYRAWFLAQTDATRYTLLSVYATSPCRQPFRWGANRHGHKLLRRADDLPTEAAALLEAIAGLARLEALSREVEDALIADYDVDANQLATLLDAVAE